MNVSLRCLTRRPTCYKSADLLRNENIFQIAGVNFTSEKPDADLLKFLNLGLPLKNQSLGSKFLLQEIKFYSYKKLFRWLDLHRFWASYFNFLGQCIVEFIEIVRFDGYDNEKKLIAVIKNCFQ